MKGRVWAVGLVCGAVVGAVLYALLISPVSGVTQMLLLIAVFGGLVVLLILLRSVARSWSAQLRGKFGERSVRRTGARSLPDDEYRPFHDVLFPTENGTTQVDHLYVSRYGVFVVETKAWSGRVYGRVGDHYWTVVYRGGRKHTPLNPLRQNDGHVRAIRDALGLSRMDKRVRSVVAFVGNAQLPLGLPVHVCQGRRWVRYVRAFRASVFSDAEVEAMAGRLEGSMIESTRMARRQHKARVRERQVARHRR